MSAESQLGVAVFVGLFCYSVGAAGSLPSDKLADLVLGLGSAAATMIAAYQGAAYAFRLQNERTAADEIAAQHASVNRALFALFYYWSEQRQYQITVIDGVRGRSDAWFNLPASASNSHLRKDLIPAELSWLLRMPGEVAHLYAEILMAENRYLDLMHRIDEHATFARTTLHPALRNLGLVPGIPYENDKPLEQLIEPMVYLGARLQSEALIRFTDTNVANTLELFHRVREAMLRAMPGSTFVNFEPGAPHDQTEFSVSTTEFLDHLRGTHGARP